MTRALSLVAGMLCLTIAAGALGDVYAAYRCNKEIMAIEKRTLLILDADRTMGASTARENIARLQRCVRRNVGVDLFMVAAANYRYLGALPEAEKMYLDALREDRRPEIYLDLGVVQLQMGKTAEAVENLVRARVFNQFLDEELPGSVREEVRKRATAMLPDRM